MRRTALSEDSAATALGGLMAFFSVLIALDILYDIYIHYKIASTFEEHKDHN